MSFLHSDHPILTGMLKSTTKQELLLEIDRLREEGAEAFGLQVEVLTAEAKQEDALAEILSAMRDKPIYLTDYLRMNTTPDIDWHTLAQRLIRAAELGATLIDVPADMFRSSDMELTHDREAIAAQRELIDKLHALGAEVLMSSHVLRFIPPHTVLAIAEEHKARGADISKIVTDANSPEELAANFYASTLLARELGLPHLFLCNGTHCKRHRLFGPMLGSCMYLVTENALVGHNQPTLAQARAILDFT